MSETATHWRRSVNGEVVRAIREALGVSMREMATDVGISKSYLGLIEGGEKQPRDIVVRAIANRLGVTPNAITRYLPAPVDATDEELVDEHPTAS
jgi:transcriptional regulator with XRE-family HTH domain